MGTFDFYFTNIMSGTALFKFETWADQKFEYDASLNYYYDNDNYLENRCPRAVILRLKLPLAPNRTTGARNFITYLSQRYSKPQPALSARVEAVSKKPIYDGSAQNALSDTYLLELGGFHHPARGDFIELGWYENTYYKKNFSAPEPSVKTGNK